MLVEYFAKHFGGDARAIVVHTASYATGDSGARAYGDLPIWCVFESVPQQVLKGLGNKLGVGEKCEEAGDLVDDLDILLLGDGVQVQDQALHYGPKFKTAALRLECAFRPWSLRVPLQDVFYL